jgi:hypothetical protein
MDRNSDVNQEYRQSTTSKPPSEMHDDLRNNASPQMNAQSETSALQSTTATIPIMTTARQKPRTRQPKVQETAVETIAVKRKPYGMSYGGMTQAEYITYMIARGAR